MQPAPASTRFAAPPAVRPLAPARPVAAVTALTLLAAVESSIVPWAPYFILFPILALVIPLRAKIFSFGSFRAAMTGHTRLLLAVFALFLLWEYALGDFLYQKLLGRFGRAENPFFSVDGALDLLAATAAARHGFGKTVSEGIFAFYAVIWAPIGEELLYWGYLYPSLRLNRGFAPAALVTGGFFGLRHGLHFLFLWPHIPYAAAAVFMLTMAGSALLNSYLFEKTKSLWPLIVLHALDNIFWFAVS
jgi:membrane protease YdiL (CAAX protease family)